MIKLFNRSDKIITAGYIKLFPLTSITIDETTTPQDVMQKIKSYKKLNMLNVFTVTNISTTTKPKQEVETNTIVKPIAKPISKSNNTKTKKPAKEKIEQEKIEE